MILRKSFIRKSILVYFGSGGSGVFLGQEDRAGKKAAIRWG